MNTLLTELSQQNVALGNDLSQALDEIKTTQETIKEVGEENIFLTNTNSIKTELHDFEKDVQDFLLEFNLETA